MQKFKHTYGVRLSIKSRNLDFKIRLIDDVNKIDLSLKNEQFKLETPETLIQLKLGWFVAGKVIDQFRSVLVPFFVQKETLVERTDGKSLVMNFMTSANKN